MGPSGSPGNRTRDARICYNARMAEKVVATNRKATFDFFISDRFEAGIALTGSEIKSIRARQMSIKEAYVQVDRGEVWLVNAHIAPYEPASRENHAPRRRRKLLLHRKEIEQLWEATQQKGLTILPLRVYLKNGLAKIEIALARGKKKFDKRAELARRDAEREMARAHRQRY